MLIEKEYFDNWMKRIFERFDSLENRITKPSEKEKERRTLNGEILLDNQDLCIMLNVTKRTLQRYRTVKGLPFKRIDQKTYYLASDVEKFIRKCFKKNDNRDEQN